MGLDIYCRWGNTNEDGEIIDGMTPEEREAQFTGFADATAAGYLRYNWPGVRFMRDTAATLDMQSPISALFPDWQGSNGEEFEVDAAQMARLAETRAALTKWLADGAPGAETAIGDPGWREYFVGKVQATVEFIDFVEAHQGREKLRIEFN